jgi:hypothetical protein
MYNGPQNRFRTYSRLPHPIDIKLGDNTAIQATHKGLIQVQNHWIKALHLPTFRYSLLSVGDLDIHGYRTSFENGRCIISDSTVQKIMMTGQKNGMLYELDATGPPASDTIYAAALISSNRTGKLSIKESKMWHRRLGHLGDAAIKSSRPSRRCSNQVYYQRLRRRWSYLRGLHAGETPTQNNPCSSPMNHYTMRESSLRSLWTIRHTLVRWRTVFHCLHR